IGNKRRQSIILTLGPAVFHRDVLPLDVSAFLQPLMECCECIGGLARGPTAEKADHRHRRLLRARRERQHGRRATERRDEVAAFHGHSITSSARVISDGGKSRPSALAVLRLIASSILLGNSTGKSPGLAPLRIRST